MSNDFRLISLYIGSFDCMKSQTVNFCSDYRTIAREDADGTLHLDVKERNVLPDNFFALNEGNDGNGCVKSVSAIIGKNGSGKTTLARLLCNLPVSDERKPEWKTALIYEKDGNISCYTTFQQVNVDLISVSGVRRSILPEHNLFFPSLYQIFYYSPHFTTERFDVHTIGFHVDKGIVDEGDFVKDISTTGLLLHPVGNSALLRSVGALQSSIFDIDEKIRLFEFIAEYKGKSKRVENKFEIPMPESIAIGVHEEGFRFAIQEIKGNAGRGLIVKDATQKQIATGELPQNALIYPVDTYLQGMTTAFEKFAKEASQHSFVINVFMAYAARYIQECGIFSAGFPQEKLRIGFLADLKGFINGGGWADEEKIKEFFKHCRPELPSMRDDNKFDSNVNPMVELIELLQEICRASNQQLSSSSLTENVIGKSIYCRIGEPKLLEKVCRLVMLHGVTRVISPYLKFDVIPPMSSGEMSFLTLFARLYHFIKETEIGNNVIVFFDEVETTLHPEWQRRLVAYCIRFFEVFLPGRQYQLIFASHSPMLLSDIPKGNVCCLHKDKSGKCYVKAMHVNNTFAANIYDLYSKPFVLTGGPIGDFARKKLKGLVKNQNEKIVKLVGDELLKRLLNRRLLCEKLQCHN